MLDKVKEVELAKQAYRNLLHFVAALRSDANITVPEREADLNALLRAESRQKVLDPLLKEKRFTRFKWAEKANVEYKTMKRYYYGKTRNLQEKTRTDLAKVLGIPPEELPQ